MGGPESNFVFFFFFFFFCENIYKIIGHYNPPVRITIYHLTPFILCVIILGMSARNYSLKLIPNDRFLRNFFLAILFYIQNFCYKSAQRNSLRWRRLAWPLNYDLTSNKPTHYQVEYGVKNKSIIISVSHFTNWY